MIKRKIDTRISNHGSMLNQKTNEDFNKKKPDPNDPNEQKDRAVTAVPDIMDDDGNAANTVKSVEETDSKHAVTKNEGSE